MPSAMAGWQAAKPNANAATNLSIVAIPHGRHRIKRNCAAANGRNDGLLKSQRRLRHYDFLPPGAAAGRARSCQLFLSILGRGRPPSLSATTTTISEGFGASGTDTVMVSI